MTPKTESVSELFVVVRRCLDSCEEPHLDAESALEKRVMEVELASRRLLEDDSDAAWDGLKAALAATPSPVFTLKAATATILSAAADYDMTASLERVKDDSSHVAWRDGFTAGVNCSIDALGKLAKGEP